MNIWSNIQYYEFWFNDCIIDKKTKGIKIEIVAMTERIQIEWTSDCIIVARIYLLLLIIAFIVARITNDLWILNSPLTNIPPRLIYAIVLSDFTPINKWNCANRPTA